MYRVIFLMSALVGMLVHPLAAPARASRGVIQQTAIPSEAVIYAPLPGEALQGSVPISGHFAVEGFQSVEFSFAYVDDPTQTWFLIAWRDTPITSGPILQWDTTTISDGVYTLRMVVTLEGGGQEVVTVPGVRVRNYSPIETNTPTAIIPTSTPEPGDTPFPETTLTPLPTVTPILASPTPLPPNPEQLSEQAVVVGVGKGAMATVGVFALMGIYASLRSIWRRRYERD